jgi:hypothetical protein
MNISGIDISYEDGPMDWSSYKLDFTYIKASEGLDIDKLFREQWRESKGKTVRGPLHVFRPIIDVKQAAKALAEILNGDMGELPLAVYLHKTDGRQSVMLHLVEFITEYKYLSGAQTVVICTSLDFLNLVQAQQYPYLGTFPLWLISYPFVNHDKELREQKIREVMDGKLMLAFPPPPRPFSHVTFWRWTNAGTPDMVPGYPKDKNNNIRLSLYHGNHIQSLFHEFNISVPETTEKEKEVIYYGRVKKETVIRNGPFENYTEIGRLPENTLVQSNQERIDTIHRKWLHIIKAENEQGGAILLKNNKQVTEMPSWILASDIEDINKTRNRIIKEVIIKFDDDEELKVP